MARSNGRVARVALWSASAVASALYLGLLGESVADRRSAAPLRPLPPRRPHPLEATTLGRAARQCDRPRARRGAQHRGLRNLAAGAGLRQLRGDRGGRRLDRRHAYSPRPAGAHAGGPAAAARGAGGGRCRRAGRASRTRCIPGRASRRASGCSSPTPTRATCRPPCAPPSPARSAMSADLFTIGTDQELPDFWNRTLMPIAYMGISAQYPPALVNNPRSADRHRQRPVSAHPAGDVRRRGRL